MKKITTIAAAVIVATLSSTAMAGEWFAGIEGSYDHFWCLKRKAGGVPCQKHS